MTNKSRKDLKGIFRTGKVISPNDFASLIDSTLNKRDDCFMGKWRKGVSYFPGAVVVHEQALWQLNTDEPLCSLNPPKKGEEGPWKSLIVPVEDNDWQIVEDENKDPIAMYAKIYDCVGIGQLFESALPEAVLDIEEAHKGRFMILPKKAAHPSLSLVKFGADEEEYYFLEGLNEHEMGFNTNTPLGFIFRQGTTLLDDDQEMDFTEGDLLMVIQPDSNGLARVGISTAQPAAMLDITDRRKGQFLFNPEDKNDPAFCIVNLAPDSDRNYLTAGVGATQASLITDAPKGFVFKHGKDYEEYCAKTNLDQGEVLVVIKKDEAGKAQLGVGTEQPCGLIDAVDEENGRFLVQAAAEKGTSASIVNTQGQAYYATQVLQNDQFITVSNATGGYSFNIGADVEDACTDLAIPDNLGEDAMVILKNHNIGMGTATPEYHLELNDENSGKFLFNLDDKRPNPTLSIVNTRPETHNYLALGADNNTSIFISNSTYGFSFRQGEPVNGDNEVNIGQPSETLFSVLPNRENSAAEIRMFPEKSQTDDPQAEVRANAKMGVFRQPENFELDVNGTSRTLNSYTLADNQKMKRGSIEQMPAVLEDLKKLKPIVFEWEKAQLGIVEEMGKQFGIESDQVSDLFHAATKVTADPKEGDSVSISYQTLVPVLVKAIKELSEKIEELEKLIPKK
ncbi:MAG: hypothetical protein AAGG68_20665 [Bacteroidota bacterium]